RAIDAETFDHVCRQLQLYAAVTTGRARVPDPGNARGARQRGPRRTRIARGGDAWGIGVDESCHVHTQMSVQEVRFGTDLIGDQLFRRRRYVLLAGSK